MYACDLCDKIFQKSSSLLRHKYEHTGDILLYEPGQKMDSYWHKHTEKRLQKKQNWSRSLFMDDNTPFLNSILTLTLLTFWQHIYFAGKHDSKLNLIGRKQKGGHLHPSLQQWLNKHQRGLVVCFCQLCTFTLPVSHEKDWMLQNWFSETQWFHGQVLANTLTGVVFFCLLLSYLAHIRLSFAPDDLMLAESCYTLTEGRALSTIVLFLPMNDFMNFHTTKWMLQYFKKTLF